MSAWLAVVGSLVSLGACGDDGAAQAELAQRIAAALEIDGAPNPTSRQLGATSCPIVRIEGGRPEGDDIAERLRLAGFTPRDGGADALRIEENGLVAVIFAGDTGAFVEVSSGC